MLFLSEVFRITIYRLSVYNDDRALPLTVPEAKIITSVHGSRADTIEIARKYQRQLVVKARW